MGKAVVIVHAAMETDVGALTLRQIAEFALVLLIGVLVGAGLLRRRRDSEERRK